MVDDILYSLLTISFFSSPHSSSSLIAPEKDEHKKSWHKKLSLEKPLKERKEKRKETKTV